MNGNEQSGRAAQPCSAPAGALGEHLLASLAIVVSTLFWGTLWIPLRRLSEAGVGAPWATAAGFFVPLLVLLPFALARRRSIAAGGWPLVRAGLLMAACVALYAEALLRGTVARVILLFYLTPVWSTLLARVFLGEPITSARLATVSLGLAGMFVVFGAGSGAALPQESAEWMGLASGFLWGASMVTLRRTAPQASEFDKGFVQFAFLGVLFALLTLVPGGRPWVWPTLEVVARAAPWLLLLGVVWMPVVLWLTAFGGSRLDPGRVAVLLTLEVVIGLGSAALLTDEPLGAHELAGAALITAACASEFFAVGTAGRR